MKTDKESIRIRLADDQEGFLKLRDEWNGLLERAATKSYFLRWEWLWRWWNVYGADKSLRIILVYKNEELIGIAPFYLTVAAWMNFFRVRRLIFLGTLEDALISEYMDLIYTSAHAEAVVKAVMEFISSGDLCDDIALRWISAESRTPAILEKICAAKKISFRRTDTMESPYITLPPDYSAFLANCGNSLRHQIRSNLTKLSRRTDAAFRRTSTPEELEEDFSELVRLHQCRWESRRLPGSFSDEPFRKFQGEVMKDMLGHGHLDLWFLSVSGKNIAVLYNICYNGKIYFYQSGLDVGFAREISPGLLLHNRCIEDAIKRGLTEYDFLIQGYTDSYKRRWTKEARPLCEVYMNLSGVVKMVSGLKRRLARTYR